MRLVLVTDSGVDVPVDVDDLRHVDLKDPAIARTVADAIQRVRDGAESIEAPGPYPNASNSASVPDIEDEVEFTRAGGDCICPQCLKSYYQHPFDGPPSGLWPYKLFLHRLCDGSLVKL